MNTWGNDTWLREHDCGQVCPENYPYIIVLCIVMFTGIWIWQAYIEPRLKK